MAHKVTKAIRYAWESGRVRTVGNTHTDGSRVFLHGHCIIYRDPKGRIYWTLAGWNTATTRERIRGIAGVQVWQRKREPGTVDETRKFKPINPTAWHKITEAGSVECPAP